MTWKKSINRWSVSSTPKVVNMKSPTNDMRRRRQIYNCLHNKVHDPTPNNFPDYFSVHSHKLKLLQYYPKELFRDVESKCDFFSVINSNLSNNKFVQLFGLPAQSTYVFVLASLQSSECEKKKKLNLDFIHAFFFQR